MSPRRLHCDKWSMGPNKLSQNANMDGNGRKDPDMDRKRIEIKLKLVPAVFPPYSCQQWKKLQVGQEHIKREISDFGNGLQTGKDTVSSSPLEAGQLWKRLNRSLKFFAEINTVICCLSHP